VVTEIDDLGGHRTSEQYRRDQWLDAAEPLVAGAFDERTGGKTGQGVVGGGP
jgi:hypothetical protein